MKKGLKTVSIILSLSMLLSVTACQNGTFDNAQDPQSGQVTDVQDVLPGTVSAAFEQIDDNGKPINDFDEFVNRDLYREFEEAGYPVYSSVRKSSAVVSERIADILENTDLSTLDENDGLYKTIWIYRDLVDDPDPESRSGSIREYLDPIMNIETLDDVYALYGNDRYTFQSRLFRFRWRPDDYGDMAPYIRPDNDLTAVNYYRQLLDSDETAPEAVAFFEYLDCLGMSKDRFREICDNVTAINEYSDRCSNDLNAAETLWFLGRGAFDEVSCPVPVHDILMSVGGLGPEMVIVAHKEYPELLKEVYVPENIPMLRDDMLFNAMIMLYLFSGIEYPDPDYREIYVYNARDLLTNASSDVLAEEYLNRYAGDGSVEEARELYEELHEAALSVIDECDYLSEDSKKAAKLKIYRMHLYIGEKGRSFDLSDVELTDDTIENVISLLSDYYKFARKQTIFRDEARSPFYMNMLEINAYYYEQLNAIVLSDTYLCDDAFQNAASYEEKLGYLSSILAHEIGHAYDPRSMSYDRLGYYDPWLTEEETGEYSSRALALADFYDGKVTENGNTIDGRGVLRETIADLMGMQICLKVLSGKEDPDYDTFFRSFAFQRAAVNDASYEQQVLEAGYMPDKYRINYTLAQFDIFYEVYDIDENSPYYVPADKRLKFM